MSFLWLLNTIGVYIALVVSGLLGGFTIFAYTVDESVSDYIQEHGCPTEEVVSETPKNPVD